MPVLPESLPGVVSVELMRGPQADADAPPDLLVEVPHGADQRHHYEALRARLQGLLPDELHVFFHVNTDIGAWHVGVRVAQRVIEVDPTRSALVLRSLIPRTFVDCNRLADAPEQGDLVAGGITAGLPAYIRDPDDRALLLDLHRRYVEVADRAYDAVCGPGGFALEPHTYGPVTLDVHRVDDDIVANLRRAHQPNALAVAPVRAEIDLITRAADGVLYAPDGMPEALLDAYATLGVAGVEGGAYHLHPATQGHRFSTRYPGQVLCLEVRRDLLVFEWTPFAQQQVDPAAVHRLSEPLVTVIDRWLAARR